MTQNSSTLLCTILVYVVVTVLGNLLMILAISSALHLHNPMYLFLFNMSLTDIGFSSCIIPSMLVNIQNHKKSTTYAGCLTQVFWVFFPFSMFGQSTALCNVLWLLGGYLLLFTIPSHHEPLPVWLVGPGFVFHQSFGLPAALLNSITRYFLPSYWNL